MPQPGHADYQSKKAERERRALEHAPMPWWWLKQRDPIARFTLYLVLFTCALVFVGILGWWNTQAQLGEMRAQRQMTVAQLRADLKQEEPQILPIGQDEKPVAAGDNAAAWIVSPQWTNSGETDALGYVGWFDIKTFSGSKPHKVTAADCPALTYQRTRPVVIQRGQGFRMFAKRIQAADAVRAQANTEYILLVGHIEYRDVFPDTPTHHNDWCIALVPINLATNTWSDLTLFDSAD